jgi:hypothetical protein
MNKNGPPRRQVLDYAAAAIEQMKIYCAAHPGSPSAMRRPQLFFRSDLWIALLGPSLEEGIVGIGPTVAAALRAFDAHIWSVCRNPSLPQSRSVRYASADSNLTREFHNPALLN